MLANAWRGHYSVNVEWPVSQVSMNAGSPNQLSTVFSNRIVPAWGKGEPFVSFRPVHRSVKIASALKLKPSPWGAG